MKMRLTLEIYILFWKKKGNKEIGSHSFKKEERKKNI
jgi:hypothetical protein